MLAALALAVAAAAQTPRPNVLLILTDDQGAADLGAYGADDLETPALDRLAATGLRFTQFYAAAPVCSPSRASLLTGRAPWTAGVPGNVPHDAEEGEGLPAEELTLAELFRAAGYRTAHVGKWHLGHADAERPEAQGFESSFGHLGGCIDNWSHFFYWSGPNRHDLRRDGVEVFESGRYFPDLMLEEALRVVRADDERPFLLYLAANAPHYPYQGEAERLARCRERGLEHPRDLYAAFLESLDARIGALLDELELRGLRDDTIVVYQSDHGHSTEVRAHGGGGTAGGLRGAKFSLFEGGIRVPALISWSGHLPAGETRAQPAHAADWLPTLLELCSIEPPERPLAGRSLVPVLRDSAAPPPHEALFWRSGSSWAVRRGDWKLLSEPRDTSRSADAPPLAGPDALFLVDLAADPSEQHNLAPHHPDLVAELTRLAATPPPGWNR